MFFAADVLDVVEAVDVAHSGEPDFGEEVGEEDVGAGSVFCYQFTVRDVTAPVVTVPSNRVDDATIPAGAPVSFVVSAADAFEGPVPVTCDRVSGFVFTIGMTTVSCTASDSSGNTSDPAAFTVTVRGASAQLNDLALCVTGIGPGSSLSAKVAKAQDDLAKGKSACADLETVIDEARDSTFSKAQPAPGEPGREPSPISANRIR